MRKTDYKFECVYFAFHTQKRISTLLKSRQRNSTKQFDKFDKTGKMLGDSNHLVIHVHYLNDVLISTYRTKYTNIQARSRQEIKIYCQVKS